MEGTDGRLDREVLKRLPLAQAVLHAFAWALQTNDLNEVYDQNRGRCHERLLSFPSFVKILFSCLTGPWKSARSGLLKAEEEGELPVSLKAFYDKLKKTPVEVSLGLLRHVASRLRQIASYQHPDCPVSLRNMTCLIMDGKVIKHVCRRLKELRLSEANACKLLGPRSLVVAERWSGLLHDLVVDLDGEANEVKHTGALLHQIRATLDGPFLIIGDRAFGIFKVCAQTIEQQGHFLFRKHETTVFIEDSSQSAIESTDQFGRKVQQHFGCLTRGKSGPSRERIAVRKIVVTRDQEPLTLITSLTDAQAYPVDNLLDSYLARWNVENLFQQITQTFQLRHLFSTQPQGMLLQLVLTLLMYNVIQIVKCILSVKAKQPLESISTTMLFRDVQEELISVTRVLTAESVSSLIETFAMAELTRRKLEELLASTWRPSYCKANYKPRDPTRQRKTPPSKLRQTKPHDSVIRILNRKDQ